MPLPDERPRQSVANLIGRFEQQTKRQSLTSIPPRTGTPVSHLAGDGSQEVKEKREWPPRPKAVETEPPAISSLSTDPLVRETTPDKPALPTPEASPKLDPTDLHKPPPIDNPSADAVEVTAPTAVSPPADPAPTEAATAESEPQTKPSKPAPARQSSTGLAASARASVTPSKPKAGSRPSTANAAKTTRTPAKSPPISFHNAPVISASTSTPPAHMLRTSSNMKNVKAPAPRPSSSASVRAPITPARSKTPAVARPKTPASTVRPKTPAPAMRPKTPASGLFAPTAASLARARNGPEAPPPPTKKATLSADVAERLFKPTASSISKVRLAVSPPPTVPKTPSKRGAALAKGTPPRGAVASAKPRTSVPASKAKEETAKAEEQVVEKAAVTPQHIDEPEQASSVTADEHFADVAVDIAVTHEPEEHYEEPASDPMELKQASPEDIVSANAESADLLNDETAAEALHIEVQAADTPTDDNAADYSLVEPVLSDAEEDVHTLPDSPSPTKDKDNLEDIVTMLESDMPASIKLSMPDDSAVAGEIPDEE